MMRPNIFVIVLDTLRRDRIGAYGHHRDTTPNIDRFAAEAVMFENAYTSAPWTLPAHTSLFTGLACEEHGVTSDLCTLGETPPTLAQLLTHAGYTSLGYSANPFVGSIYGLARGFNQFVNAHELRTDFSAPADWVDATPTEHDKGGADVVRRISADLRSAEQNRPLFAFVNLTEPHHPYYPPTPFRLRYWRELGEFDAPTLDATLAASELNFNVMTGRVALNQDAYRLLNAWYDGGVRYADYCVGKLLDAISASGRAEHAMIVIMSDKCWASAASSDTRGACWIPWSEFHCSFGWRATRRPHAAGPWCRRRMFSPRCSPLQASTKPSTVAWTCRRWLKPASDAPLPSWIAPASTTMD